MPRWLPDMRTRTTAAPTMARASTARNIAQYGPKPPVGHGMAQSVAQVNNTSPR